MNTHKIALIFVSLMLVLSACHRHAKPKLKEEKHVDVKSKTVVDTNRILMSRAIFHTFSDPIKKDTFKVYLVGSSIVSSKIKFELVTWNHHKIYNEQFEAYDVADIDPKVSDREKYNVVMARFNDFLKDDAFVQPAIDKNSKPDIDYVDLNTYQDIKTDTTATGFFYAYGYESTIEIAWSKRNKKVVICFASD